MSVIELSARTLLDKLTEKLVVSMLALQMVILGNSHGKSLKLRILVMTS